MKSTRRSCLPLRGGQDDDIFPISPDHHCRSAGPASGWQPFPGIRPRERSRAPAQRRSGNQTAGARGPGPRTAPGGGCRHPATAPETCPGRERPVHLQDGRAFASIPLRIRAGSCPPPGQAARRAEGQLSRCAIAASVSEGNRGSRERRPLASGTARPSAGGRRRTPQPAAGNALLARVSAPRCQQQDRNKDRVTVHASDGSDRTRLTSASCRERVADQVEKQEAFRAV